MLRLDLPAQAEALGTDGLVTGWVVDGGGQARDLVAVLAAEAAFRLKRTLRNVLQRTGRGFGNLSRCDDRLGEVHTLLADVHAGAGHERSSLLAPSPAERAGQIGGMSAAHAPAAGLTGGFDDLVHPPVAEV